MVATEIHEDVEKDLNGAIEIYNSEDDHSSCVEGKDNKNSKQKEDGKASVDVWAIVWDENETYVKFRDLDTKGKIKSVAISFLKILGVCLTLYFFICSLSLMSSAFQILGGKTGGNLFASDFLSNPATGLIIGILVTVLVQSSSTSTSIIITMTGAGILDVHEAIPVIMGTNIGTSVTNTIVSLTQSMEREHFRKSFAGATVHDMFNLLSVLVMLPLEVVSGYLEVVTGAIIESSNLQQGSGGPELFDAIVDPLTNHVIQVNKSIITLTAQGVPIEDNASMVKTWCEQRNDNATLNCTCENTTVMSPCEQVVTVGIRECDWHDFIFANTGLSDPSVGVILLTVSLIALTSCIVSMVKILSSMMKGSVSRIIKKVINTNPRKPFGWVTGYLAMITGALLTFLVQSSSVFTSSITPLVGIGVISLKRMYPLSLGSNIGTTATGMLAGFATEDETHLAAAVQLSLCHLFFNITGIIIWYPIPFMRNIPISAAKFLGNTTAVYRWFAVLYLLMVFFIIPSLILGLSFAGTWVLNGVLIVVAVIIVFVVVVNILQNRKPNWLPAVLRTWDFLPLFMRSLQPYDKVFTGCLLCCKCCNKEIPTEDDARSVSSQSNSNDDLMDQTSNGAVGGSPVNSDGSTVKIQITDGDMFINGVVNSSYVNGDSEEGFSPVNNFNAKYELSTAL